MRCLRGSYGAASSSGCGRSRPLASLALLVFVAQVLLATAAGAASMDPAPERLVLQPAGAAASCQAMAADPTATSALPCRPDNAAFRNLASELGFALAPAGMRPARAPGFQGFAFTVGVAATAIHSGDSSRAADGTETAYWHAGTRGQGGGGTGSANPSAFVSVYSLRLEKGLPLGFTVAATLGYVGSTSMGIAGGDLRWALLEGFDDVRRHGLLAKLPDLSFGVGVNTLLGGAPVTLTTVGVDVALSKPFTVAGAVVLTPAVGYQRLAVFARADTVDATPAVDALGACGYQGRRADTGAPICGTGNASDLANDLTFDAVRTYRHRASVALSLRYEHLTASAQWLVDVTSPSGENPGLDPTRQWTTSLEAGIVF